MLFTDRGRCYWLKVLRDPGRREGNPRQIDRQPDLARSRTEKIASYVTVKNFEDPVLRDDGDRAGHDQEDRRSASSANPRKTGIGAIGLGKGDRLMDVRLTDGTQDIVLGTREGMAIRFHESGSAADGPQRVRGPGHQARQGRQGGRLGRAAAFRHHILVATERGFGKRSETGEYRVSHRGGKGIITVKTTEKTGKMVAISEVVETDDVVIVTGGGIVIRQHA